MKVYVGLRASDGKARVVVEETEPGRVVRRRLLHPRVHSPTGLEWGYGGSGPADTALSILVDFFHEAGRIPPPAFSAYVHDAVDKIARTRAWRIHQDFKFRVVAGLGRNVVVGLPFAEPAVAEVLPDMEEWRLTEDDVRKAVAAIILDLNLCPHCLSKRSAETPHIRVHCVNPACPMSSDFDGGVRE